MTLLSSHLSVTEKIANNSRMASPQSSTPPRQYPKEIQLKLYQAFIFSIPVLFSIILLLLFYLFYLKRRASSISSTPPLLPRTVNDHANITTPCESSSCLTNELKKKLCTVLFDEYMKSRETMCCVCLGEFEVKEELVQVPSCKHIFHIDCIRSWLHKNSTCPLCRAPVFSDNNSESHHHRPPNFPVNMVVPPQTAAVAP